jgi:hypothetical protein
VQRRRCSRDGQSKAEKSIEEGAGIIDGESVRVAGREGSRHLGPTVVTSPSVCFVGPGLAHFDLPVLTA